MPNALGIALVPLLGLLFGSFLNVCITRLPLHESIAHPGSHCRSCGMSLKWRHNIPVLSFLVLRGKCGFCGERFSWRYPIVEIALAVLWLCCALRWGLTPATLLAMALCFFALGLLFTDLETMLLPDRLTFGGMVLGFALSYLVAPARETILDRAAGAALGFLVPFFIRLVYQLIRKREGMGLGDAKLLAMIGAFLGWKGVVLTFVVGAVSAAVVGVVVMIRSREGSRAALPLGTFLCAASFVSLFAGDAIWRWYLGFFR